MSYIRCLSNPEGLYIIGTFVRGHAYIEVMGGRRHRRSGDMLRIPVGVFHTACARWDRCAGEGVSHRGLTIRERYLDPRTGTPCPHLSVREMFQHKRDPGHYQIEVAYKGKRFWCWRVTWEYVLRQVLAEIAGAKDRRAPYGPWWRQTGCRRRERRKPLTPRPKR